MIDAILVGVGFFGLAVAILVAWFAVGLVVAAIVCPILRRNDEGLIRYEDVVDLGVDECLDCGGTIEEVLVDCGSLRCHDCRSEAA